MALPLTPECAFSLFARSSQRDEKFGVTSREKRDHFGEMGLTSESMKSIQERAEEADDASNDAHSSHGSLDSEKDLSHGTNPVPRLKLSANWLLWLGIGAAATLNSCGLPQELSLSVGTIFLVAWALVGVTPAQLLAMGADALVELYFREYMTIGEEKVPDKGPVIFVCGPHSNQFLDPMVVSKGTTREVKYIIAAKSLRRKDLGWLFKHADPVPVERQQDLKRPGEGRITVAGVRVLGTDTKFTRDMPPADKGKYLLQVKTKRGTETLGVKEVVSDSEAVLETPPSRDLDDPQDYFVLPPVNHDKMFKAVYDHLGRGGTLGIFPEGGSHDRTELLPLKVGVCLMALGAIAKYPGLRVRLIPVGLNYFSQHKFNSRVLVKYGDAIEIDSALVRHFNAGGDAKRSAVRDLLKTIDDALHKVTVTAPDFRTLKTFWILRDLYCPTKRLLEMSSVDQVNLAQAFASDYDRVRVDPEVDVLLKRITEYSRRLNALGLRDKGNIKTAVLISSHTTFHLLWLLFLRCLYIIALYVVFLPVFVFLLPIFMISTLYSLRKSKEAVANSKVKIKGRDVMGTYKLIIALPLLCLGHFTWTSTIRFAFGEAPAVAYYFFAPFMQFVVYKRIPNIIEYLRCTRTLMMALVKKDTCSGLLRERAALKEAARALVDKVEWGYEYDVVMEQKVNRKDTISFDRDVPGWDLDDVLQGQFGRPLHDLHDLLEEDINRDLWKKDE